MSAQFGRWNLDGMPVDPDYLEKAKATIAPYGPDDDGSYTKHNIAIIYRAFHTTRESRRERQPLVTASGAIIAWDGRLDNRAELIGTLGDLLTVDSADLSIVAAAYDTWGTHCFSKLIGDWAVSIWNPTKRSLVLAKDPVGTRPLYYSFDREQVTWSTILDPLVLFAGKTFQLSQEYIAGCLSFFPAAHLTPYDGIHSVPPSCFALLHPGSCAIKKYWDFDPGKRIVYSTDGEYEEHFRAVFGEAVQRRLRSDRPILAELSGGMDSSSIVCMADTILASGGTEQPRLDTISYYDDSEPNWNERPYFTKVEEKRGRTGYHIDVSQQNPFDIEIDAHHFRCTPGSDSHPTNISRQYSQCLSTHGSRVVLSGIGGDEMMGGVPTPNPELENLIAEFRLGTLAQQLKLWALEKRRPWFHLFLDAARAFFPSRLVGVPKGKSTPPWLNSNFVRRNRFALRAYEQRVRLFGPLPSFQENLSAIDGIRRQLACSVPFGECVHEKRYPYLDRSLLEFVCAIPREQLVRPGQRRSLMRRSLAGLVPDEILQRRRKAFVARRPLVNLLAEWPSLVHFCGQLHSAILGIVDAQRFAEVLEQVRDGREVPLVSLMRTLAIESWIRILAARNIIQSPRTGAGVRKPVFFDPQIKIPALVNGQVYSAESTYERKGGEKR